MSRAVSSRSSGVAIGYPMVSMSRHTSTAMMSAPSSASRTAWLRPWPRAAPVINATFPSNRPAMFPPDVVCRFRVALRYRVGLGLRPGDGLGLEVLLESLDSVLATDAARLVAAIRGVGPVPDAAVDADGTGPDPTGDGGGPLCRGGEDAPREPVAAVVGDPHGVIVVFVGEHREHGTEDLLLGDRHRVVDIDKQRWLDVPALRQMRRWATTEYQLGALFYSLSDVAEHSLSLLGADQRPHHHLSALWVAVGHHGHGLSDELDPLVVSRAWKEHPRLHRAALAGVCADSHSARDDGRKVGIVEDDHGRLAAQLEEDPLEGRSPLLHDAFPRRGGAGERDHVDQGRQGELLADQVVRRGDDVEHAGRDVGPLGDEAPETRGVPRGVRGRLHDRGVARRQYLGHLVDRHLEGVVPGHDRADHPHRLFPNRPAVMRTEEVAVGEITIPAEL